MTSNDAAMAAEMDGTHAQAAAAISSAPSAPSFIPPSIDRILSFRSTHIYNSPAYLAAYTRALASSSYQLLDEYNHGVKFSPDATCLLVGRECGNSSGISSSARKRMRTKRNKAMHTSMSDSGEEMKNEEENKQQIEISTSSSSSSSDDSEEDSDGVFTPAAAISPSSTKRGLSMFELPPLQWQQSTDPNIASSYIYATPALATDAAAASSAASAATPSSPPSSSMLSPLLHCSPGDSLYDYLWNPSMNSSSPPSCFFLSTARCTPIQAWDAFTGKMRASWYGKNQADEMEAALSLCMAPASSSSISTANSHSIYAGYNKSIRIFNIERPGTECTKLNTWCKRASSGARGGRGRGRASSSAAQLSQSGIISTMSINPSHPSLLIAGSYNGEVGMYDLSSSSSSYSGLDHKFFLSSCGISHLCFDPSGQHLFVSLRKGEHILVYDMRDVTQPIMRLPRTSKTNQKLGLDIDPSGRWLACGDSDGLVKVFDLAVTPTAVTSENETSELQPVFTQRISRDAVSGVSFHTHFSSTVPILATCSGERQFVGGRDEADAEMKVELRDNEAGNGSALPLNTVALWSLQHTTLVQ